MKILYFVLTFLFFFGSSGSFGNGINYYRIVGKICDLSEGEALPSLELEFLRLAKKSYSLNIEQYVNKVFEKRLDIWQRIQNICQVALGTIDTLNNSKSSLMSLVGDSTFENYFSDQEWITAHSFKDKPTDFTFYASDIFITQVILANLKNVLNNSLPHIFTIKNVVNAQTQEYVYRHCKDGSAGKIIDCSLHMDDLVRGFLASTPNGKSTQKILEFFGLEAKRIRFRKFQYGKGFTVHIAVVRIRP